MDGSNLPPVAESETLVELLRTRAREQRDVPAFSYLGDGENVTESLTYGGLDRQARAIAAELQRTAESGARALLLYPSGLEFVAAFFGCLYAVAVAVPAYPPRMNRNLSRVETIVEDAGATAALTTSAILDRIRPLLEQMPALKKMAWLCTDEPAEGAERAWRETTPDGKTLAFLQYTSGSTGKPKGVMLTHANLMHNQRLIGEAFRPTRDDNALSWLPLYHDMGLIGNVLQPIYMARHCTLMSPLHFLQRPLRWLRLISRYRITTSGGPNFAFDLCVRKFNPEQLEGLDLSCWSLAFNGAEPVRPDTLERFSETYAPYGFRPEAFLPCYGLAEASLIVSGGPRAARPTVKLVDAARLEADRVSEVAPGGAGAQALVSSGVVLHGQRVAVVRPGSLTECLPDEVGEIWVSGPSVASGYLNMPEETARTFHAFTSDTGEGPFLRTGDLGFVSGGELFITGRLKDLIIIDGRNHYPQDIELTVEKCHPAIRPNGCAAFSLDAGGRERLVIVAEVNYHRRDTNLNEVADSVRGSVSEHHDIRVHALSLLRAESIPRTSSGKIQRHACRLKFLDGTLAQASA